MQSEDLPKYQGGSLGSFREGLQMLPNAALKAMGKDKVSVFSFKKNYRSVIFAIGFQGQIILKGSPFIIVFT